jgi:hypothetical protein
MVRFFSKAFYVKNTNKKKSLSQFSWGEEKLGPHFVEDLGYISMKKVSKEILSF